jgi:hypothetical protein
MNLHGIVSNTIAMVNPMETAMVQRSNGYTTDDSGRQVPTYAPLRQIRCQIQSLQYTDLMQIAGLNIQGVKRKIYLNGHLDAVIRSRREGGDLIQMQNGDTYLIVQVLEHWPDWSCLAVVLQTDT